MQGSSVAGAQDGDRGRILDSPRYALIEAFAATAIQAIGGADLFATLTHRDPLTTWAGYSGVGLGTSLRQVEGYLTDLAEVYPDISAFFAWEPHAARISPHAHGIMAGVGSEVAAAIESGRRAGRPLGRAEAAREASPSFGAKHATNLIWRAWWEREGMARIEAVRGDGGGAAMYAAKYTAKDLGPFRVWLPGELRERFVRRRRRKGRRS